MKIVKCDSFDIEINGIDFGRFDVVSEWEGFRKLQNRELKTIILSDETGNPLLADLFLNDYRIIKASPDIIGAMVAEHDESDKG